ncbi:DnaD domain protein [Clostridium sp. 19966]|uniref:DnaD domain protein n=1 Tax=Clostridium sp. 19966 TaxID=2768166 RepID=UPI0028DE5615|nr:DnaD domain protein [Clostridium sp. 19966]MDT8718673.1 DnaD domain protein [Clostridium sp. 19966]
MSTFMFKKSSNDYTPVSNIFIEKYMPKARGEFIKVYLLALKYCLSNEPGVNSTLMASALHLLESDVMNAWNYWNEEGVIKFRPLDSMGNYNIEFVDLSEDAIKPASDVNILEELSNSSTKDMLQEIEKLVARPLASKEISTYIGWQKDLNFSPELILLLIEYCVSKGKSDYRYIEKVAIGWHEAKIQNIDQAQSYIKRHEDKWIKYRKILTYLGIKDADVMKPQEEMLDKWVTTLNFSVEIVFKACDICFERLNRADFKYIDAILSSWHKDGIKTLDDIRLKDNKRQVSKKNTPSKNKNDNFNNFEQRVYDYDSLEKRLLGWDDK